MHTGIVDGVLSIDPGLNPFWAPYYGGGNEAALVVPKWLECRNYESVNPWDLEPSCIRTFWYERKFAVQHIGVIVVLSVLTPY